MKVKSMDVKDTDYRFHTLTPTDDVDLGIYEAALDFVFTNDDVLNIAISGAYGAGKSSVLATYKKKYEDKKFLHISLAHFQPHLQSEERSTSEDKNAPMAISTEAALEGKILNQLIHQIPPSRIPRTNFKIKRETSNKKILWLTILAVSCVLLGLYVFFFPQWASFAATLSFSWLSFSTLPESRLIAGAIFLAPLLYFFAWRFVEWQGIHHAIKKARVSGVDIEIFEDCKESFFDKYLNEVLYLFEKADADAIVFEDIDRYESSRIFERLHEINSLVNNDHRSDDRHGRRLRFFYLLRDDIFISKDRTKFFDFIIPIVPVVDGSNSFDKFLEYLKSANITIGCGGITLDFLQGLSLYIDDMRILQNICNEFLIYNSRLNTTEQDADKMFALVVYKNLFPRDFADLQVGQGFMFEIIGGRGKARLNDGEMKRIEAEIRHKNIELEGVRAEPLAKDELATVYALKIAPNLNIGNAENTIGRQRDDNPLKMEYIRRIQNAEDNPNSRDKRIRKIEDNLEYLKNQLILLPSRRLSEVITRENADSFFRETIFNSETGITQDFEEIKNNLYFPLVKYLVREGLLDETYSDYMTYFYPNSITQADKVFLRSITDKKSKEPSYLLDNVDKVISRIPLTYFDQKEVLNYSVFSFLLRDYSCEKGYVDKTQKLFHQMRKGQLVQFVTQFAETSTDLSDLATTFGELWTDFWAVYFTKYAESDRPTKPRTSSDEFVKKMALATLHLAGKASSIDHLMNADSANMLATYISHDRYFLNTCAEGLLDISIGIRLLEVKFVEIDGGNAHKGLLEQIYKNNSYIISYSNILLMMELYYAVTDIECVATCGYSAMMSNKESPLARYISENLDDYARILLDNCNGVINDPSEYVLSFVNDTRISTENRKEYIGYVRNAIEDLTAVSGTELWGDILRNLYALKCTAHNIIAYFTEICGQDFDETLCNFINSSEEPIIFSDAFNDEETKGKFFRSLIKAIKLRNNVYEESAKQFKLYYDSFGIDGLPIEKLRILDNCGIIPMTKGSLMFIREHYADYVVEYGAMHIKDYVSVISDHGISNLSESVALLDESIVDGLKIQLLRCTEGGISLKDTSYPDPISAYILENNYLDTDFSYLMSHYENFGDNSKRLILKLASEHTDEVVMLGNSVSHELLGGIFSSESVTEEAKQDIFLAVAPDAPIPLSLFQSWLELVGLDDFIAIFDERKQPQFHGTVINCKVLDLFKTKGLITNYHLSKNTQRLYISRPSSHRERR